MFLNGLSFSLIKAVHFQGKNAHYFLDTDIEVQVFLCIFQKHSAMATLGLKEMGKFGWEGREKILPCWLPQFSKTKLRQPTGHTFFPTFPMEVSYFLQT